MENYRLARYAQEQAREAVTSDWPTDNALYDAEHGPLLTFKDWLLGHAQQHDEPDR